MGMRKLLLTILLVCFTLLGSYAQEIGEEIKGDQVFKIHVVEAGNTLYGLHNKYNVSIEEIIKENPEAANGLSIGQRLLIPTGVSPSETKVHIVQKKETLFGISRIYNCEVDDLIDLNPGVENGLDIGQELIVPSSGDGVDAIDIESVDEQVEDSNEEEKDTIRYNVNFSDSIIEYEVKDGETLYSISRRFMIPVEKLVEDNEIKRNKIKPGQVITIALKKERIEKIELKPVLPIDSIRVDTLSPSFAIKENYNIAILLPLRIQENREVLSGMFDESTRLDQLTNISLDFLMGVQMAIDSLEELGLKADIEFYDTRGDEKRLVDFFESESAQNLDLVIGPFYPKLVEKTAAWCQSKEVRMIAVTKIPMNILKNNPYVYSMVPSDLTLIATMAKYVALTHFDDNLFLIKSQDKEVQNRIELFKSVYNANVAKGSSQIKMMNVGNSSGRELFNAIDEDTTTLFICLEKEVKSIMNFVNTLNAAKNYSPRVGKANVYLVGTHEWMDHEAFNSYYRNRFQFHFASSSFLDFSSDSTKPFIERYREKYSADPSRYSLHGFDVMLSQGAELLLGIDRTDGLMNHFATSTLKTGHGFENMSGFITKQYDYQLFLLEIIENINYFEETSAGNN